MQFGFWRQRASITIFVFLVALAPQAGLADVLVGESAVMYGRVLSANASHVIFKAGCDGNVTKSAPWSEVRSIVFDAECKEHEVSPPSAGLLPCAQERVAALKVYPSSGRPPIFARSLQLEGGLARMTMMGDEGSLTGPREAISAIARLRVCPTELSGAAEPPAAFCLEPRQFAVNWSLDPAMPNTVFTRGFAVFVETRPLGAAAPQLDVRGALGTALTVWTSGLLKYKDKLGPTVSAYLQTTVSRSASYMLLTPPQVIQVKCRDNASMIVRVSVTREGDFGPGDSGYLAKAQIEGRTVLLNAVDHKFGYALNRQISAGAHDLIWVLAHELGHSFGLKDEYLGQTVPSIMNPDTRPMEITERDASALAASLEKSVKGSSPGYFNATQCGGLRVRRASRPASKK